MKYSFEDILFEWKIGSTWLTKVKIFKCTNFSRNSLKTCFSEYFFCLEKQITWIFKLLKIKKYFYLESRKNLWKNLYKLTYTSFLLFINNFCCLIKIDVTWKQILLTNIDYKLLFYLYSKNNHWITT